MPKTSPRRPHFVASNQKAKSKIIARFVQIARKERLSYDDFLYVCQQARRKLSLRRPKRERKLPQLLPEAELKRFFGVIQDCGEVEHEIMLKFLFFTAVRVSELVKIKVDGVDLGRCKVFIDQGKGAKDRYILFPASFRLVLKTHLTPGF
jgi:integrase/recombinase XerD